MNRNFNKKVATLEQPPNDSISGLAWSTTKVAEAPQFRQIKQVQPPAEQRLAVSSWDGTVRVYRVALSSGYNKDILANPLQLFQGTFGPILCVCVDNGSYVFSGGADGNVRMHDVNSGQSKVLGKHEGPVAAIVYNPANSQVYSGGVDGCVKSWNGMGNTPTAEIKLTAIIRKMDCKNGFLAILLANQTVAVYHLATGQQKILDNTKFTDAKGNFSEAQWSSVALIPSETMHKEPSCQGIIIGSTSGRAGVIVFEPTATIPDKKSPVDGILPSPLIISGHPTKAKRDSGDPCTVIHDVDVGFKMIVASAGGDGVCALYSLCRKIHLSSHQMDGPLIACKLDPFGSLLAMASSYDWSGGYRGNTGQSRPTVQIIMVGDDTIPQSRYM